MDSTKRNVEEIDTKIPFSFGIDSSGNYGYIKDGADSVTPFKTIPQLVKVGRYDAGSSNGSKTIDISSVYEDYKNLTVDDFIFDFVCFYCQYVGGSGIQRKDLTKSYDASTGKLTLTCNLFISNVVNTYIYVDVYILKGWKSWTS